MFLILYILKKISVKILYKRSMNVDTFRIQISKNNKILFKINLKITIKKYFISDFDRSGQYYYCPKCYKQIGKISRTED